RQEAGRHARNADAARPGPDRDLLRRVSAMTNSSPWSLDRHAGKAGWRRLLLTLLVLGTAAFGGLLMWKVLGSNGFNAAEAVFFAIFVVMFAWTAISFWSGFFGF